MFKPEYEDKYKLIKGIYSFINEDELNGDNLKYNKMYSRLARFYNISQKFYFLFKFGNEFKFRNQFLHELTINDEDKVLEVSAGTADNFRFLNPNAEYYAADITLAMLKKAKSHCKHWKIKANFIHCEGENLPFPDDFFECVFHCGGINYFNDKEKAIQEMIRVAKPGTRLLIVDETDKLVKSNYQKNPFLKGNYEDAERASIPINLVPKDMLNVSSDIICEGTMYKLMFTKPYYKVQKISK